VRKKRTSKVEEEETGELNIVPYLDILVNLIMFLLVSQATLVSLGMVDVTAPTYSAPGGGGGAPPKESNDLKLTIGVARDGYYIAAKGGVLPGEENKNPDEMTADGVHKAPPTIPKKADGTYDYPSLSAKLRSIKTVFPDARAMFLSSDPLIPYDVIVKTLDASREDAKGDLFPDVAFAKIN
jgi:biopolymer transport protein ExbD